MNCLRQITTRTVIALVSIAATLVLSSCTKASIAQTSPVDLTLDTKAPFRFVVYGDTRFHNPTDTEAANPLVRKVLVEAITEANPSFICLTGDIVYKGYEADDWAVWDSETSAWRGKKIPIYPALGNHDLQGDPKVALGNYFRRFPELKQSRYYSLHVASVLILVLDSSLDEITGPQGDWLKAKLDHAPSDVRFVLVMDHHPPYTSSSDEKKFVGGHSARPEEQALAKVLEGRQGEVPYQIVFFSGHVHNYERHEHGGITYFVSGGGGAHAYPVERAPGDLFRSKDINYHYLEVEVDREQLSVTMHRVDLTHDRPAWTTPDSVRIGIPKRSARLISTLPAKLR